MPPTSAPPAVAARPPLPAAEAYEALRTRDTRFDGRLFVGVTSTGIYCRPVCRVRLPRPENCRFFAHAAGAEQAGFRPCLRCRPELAPGLSRSDACLTLAEAALPLLDDCVGDPQRDAITQVARRLGVSDRHLRRLFEQTHGVSPLQWLTTRRLLLAKQLLTDTSLPVSAVAQACGYGSLRRFQAAFGARYRLPPTGLRRAAGGESPAEGCCLRLTARLPWDATAAQHHLRERLLPGVEAWDGCRWWHTLAWDGPQGRREGWIHLQWAENTPAVWLTVAEPLVPAVAAIARRVRQMLDLDMDPARLPAELPGLAGPVQPGLRVPGCLDGFEAAVRIVLGQQVSVAVAQTLAARLAQRWGAPVSTPVPGLDRLFPEAAALAAVPVEVLSDTLGLFRQRAQALHHLARGVAEGRLDLRPGADVQAQGALLSALPGVGPWTVDMIALRVLAWPDAFPADDGVLRRHGSPARLRQQVQGWRPWRAYAAQQLWHRAAIAAAVSRPSPTLPS